MTRTTDTKLDPMVLAESTREREKPSGRKARDEIAYPGNFRG